MNRWSRSEIPGRLNRLLSDARFLADPDRDEEAAPFWMAGTPEGSGSMLGALRERFQNRLRRKEELRQEWTSLEERRSGLAPEQSAQEHFEYLTGHRVSDFEWPEATPPPRAGRQMVVASRKQVAGVACVLLALLVPLLLTSQPTDPFSTETTSLSGYHWDEVGERTRRLDKELEGGSAQARSATPTYAMALSQARSSRRVLFGFIERYDREGLLLARDMLRQARSVDTGYPEPKQVEHMAQVLDSLVMHTY